MKNDDNSLAKGKESLNKFIKYSSLAFEMGIIIGAGAYGGVYLDEYFSFEQPILTIILSLFAVVSSLYLVIKRINNDNK